MTIKKTVLIFLFLFFVGIFFSQQKKVDSLLKVLKTQTTDTGKVKIYLKISISYLSQGNVDTAFTYIQQGYSLAQKQNYIKGLSTACNYMGQVYNYRGNLDSAITYFTRSMNFFKALKDTSGEAGLLNNIGVVYKAHGNIAKALESFFQSLKIKERLHDTIGMANAYTNLGNLYSENKDPANTIKYHTLALNLRRKSRNEWGISNSLMAIGLFYQNQDELDKALPYLQEGLAMSEKLGDQEAIAVGYYNVANVYYKQLKIDEAETLYLKALNISKKINNYEGIATCLQILGEISIYKKDLVKAIKLLEDAYTISEKIDRKELMSNIAGNLSNAYEKQGDFKQAFKYHKIRTVLRDSLFSIENTRKLTSEGINYEHEKEKIILQKEQEKKEAIAKSEAFKKDLIIGTSVLFILLGAIFTLIILKRFKESRKQKDIIEQQRNEMIDSINYAKRIQFALLAHSDLLKNNLPDHFIFFKPKDIVSGDFYWATKKDNFFYLAVCDSTGHGVPGAFMSLLNTSFLNEAINEKNILTPNEVLNHVRKRLLENMDGGQDGMDAILIKIPLNTSELKIQYAAANNTPVLIRDNVIVELQKDKMPVGKGENMKEFNLYNLDLLKGDTLYLYTDGFADQFGGPKGKKFKYKQLNQLLLEHCNEGVVAQKENLDLAMEKWKGKLEQVDDVCVIGIKI